MGTTGRIFLSAFRWRIDATAKKKGLTQTHDKMTPKRKHVESTPVLFPIFGVRHPTNRSPLFLAWLVFSLAALFCFHQPTSTMRVLAVLALLGSAAAFAPAPS